MDHSYHGRPPARRRALGDATFRANEDTRAQRPRNNGPGIENYTSSSPKQLPHNESLVPNGTLAVSHELQEQASPQNKRISAVINHEPLPHNPKRDSEISNASTNASNTPRRRKTHIGPWQLGRTIGRGGCSRVRLVRHSGTGQYGAAKIISKAAADRVRALSMANLIETSQGDPTMFPGGKVIPFGIEREICIMKVLNHPNIVQLYDVWENRDELYLIMEFVDGGELFGYIGERGGLPEIEVVHIFRQLIAALLYCHRISIHHRDLKPENILLDKTDLTIKIVDFGMAALQPQGKKLTTPCGSPHYAAPEILRANCYDGGKADVWSCGVILFVLLTGTPPFNYSGEERDLKHLFKDIAKANYRMPRNISKDAQDLIRQILVPEPKNRIELESIWTHPFMSHFCEELMFINENTTMEHWVGPPPDLKGWSRLERSMVDREILRYLRTLWHSEKEEVLIQRLLNNKKNEEKMFYSFLQKYRNDQLENYVPSSHHAVAPSNSDHHHNKRHSPSRQDIDELPTRNHQRSQSAYSILNDEHLQSKHSFYEPPSSEATYDPFRSSKQPIIPAQDKQHNVVVHRRNSAGSGKLRPVTALGHRSGSSLRMQALRNSKQSSAVSRESSKRSTPSQYSQRSVSAKRRSVSRSSMVSSHWPSSPPVIARPGSLGKRGVSFSHLRGASVATANTWKTEVSQNTVDSRKHPPGARDSGGSYTYSSLGSTFQQSPARRAIPRAAASPIVPRLRVRKPESPSKYIQSEVRKVSSELGKAMEEAFNRASISSSTRSINTDLPRDAPEYESPSTSFSNRDSGGSTLATPNTKTLANRPLPAIPDETPNTFLQRRLAETRDEIARRFGDGGNVEHFNQVLQHLDHLMQPTTVGMRASSAPAKSPEHPSPLHVIPEEVKADGDDRFETYSTNYRAVTDPVRPNLQGRRTVTEHASIRLVDQSPTPIAPLNIRKRSGGSTHKGVEDSSVPRSDPAPNSDAPVQSHKKVQDNLLGAKTIEKVAENRFLSTVPDKKESTVKKKKSSWFRKTPEEKERTQEIQQKPSTDLLQIPEAWQGLDDRIKRNTSPVTGTAHATKHIPKESDTSNSSEFPMRPCGTANGKTDTGGTRKGFFGLFGKKSKDDKGKGPMELGDDEFSSSSLMSSFEFAPENDIPARTGPPELQTNWLSRFLGIKPASKILCFQIGRGKTRQDLVLMLRNWQRFGVRDLTFDRQSNVINARIDKSNHLKIKPVSFVIELFVVLEHGRRASLCLARFTQTRGAASSFRKVVDVVEDVCRSRCVLVEDEEKKAAMCEILT